MFQSLDTELFRFLNLKLSNPIFDALMPFLSGNPYFIPALVVAGLWVFWKGGARARVCLLILGVVLALGDSCVTNTVKHALARQRPFMVLPEAHCLVGKVGSGSMPSAHAANWFAATMVAFIYYRRSIWFMLPLALLVSFSRIYNGVHYPSDVLAGAILGAGYAAAFIWLFDALWQWAGRKWFPLWWQRMPSLLAPPAKNSGEQLEQEPVFAPRRQPVLAGPPDISSEATSSSQLASCGTRRTGAVESSWLQKATFVTPDVSMDQHWVRLGYCFIALVLLARLAYIASGTIQLQEDEAYQWLWSKHLALSYYSKPPLIAYSQFLGTTIWGDTAFGVRFFSPVITAILSVLVLRFFAKEINARAGFILVLILTATPLTAAGAVLMTVDPLSVLFWAAAMLAGWRAVQDRSTTRDWLWVGLWMGLGFLSKYTELLQLLCWAVFFALWPPVRKQLRRPGPYLALAINFLFSFPVLIWNYRRAWVTVSHVAVDAGAGTSWSPTLRFVGEFIGAEFALPNPVFFVGAAWAAIAMWRRSRHDPRLVFFFSMGTPLFLVFLLHALRARNYLNWIAPAVLPLFMVMVIYWDTRWRIGTRQVKSWLTGGLVLGFIVVGFLHHTEFWSRSFGLRQTLASKLELKPDSTAAELLTEPFLPVHLDPLHRVRDWDATARAVDQVRQELLNEGKLVFIITDHYGLAGQISFYLPEAKAHVRDQPLVYFRSSPVPVNQFFFWPGYRSRKGENAIFVRELSRANSNPPPPPQQLFAEFESVTDLGVRNVLYHDRFLLRPLQFFACRGLR